MPDDRSVAVLGVGMHPWGKWGRNFVEYGVAAARDALADAGVEWSDVQFVSGADTIRNGYPGYVPGATFAQALGWSGARVVQLRRLRLGGDGHRRGPRPDPGRPVRRRPGGRRRHHAEGVPRPGRRRAPGRSRLAALPPAGRDQPDLLRPLRPPSDGPLRRHRGRLRRRSR